MSRIQPFSVAPDAYKALLALDDHVKHSELSAAIVELVQIRSSQLNNCAFCVDSHWKRAVAVGESEHRLNGLSEWRDTKLFTPQECAALAWCEAMTLIAAAPIPDIVYANCLDHFTERELVYLSMAISTINVWNRLGIAFEFKHDRQTRGQS